MSVFDYAESPGTALEIRARSLEVQFGDGYIATAPDGLNGEQQVWDVVVDAATVEAADDMETIVRPLGRKVFDWTPPRHTAPLKWRCTTLTRTVTATVGEVNMRLRFEQWFQP